MKEPRIIDLDEAIPKNLPITTTTNNFSRPRTASTSPRDQEKSQEAEKPLSDSKIAVPSRSLTTPTPEKEEAREKKSKLPKSKGKHHLENIFSRHLREKGEGGEKRGSLYDQDGFLISSPAQGQVGDAGARSGRGWGKGKR